MKELNQICFFIHIFIKHLPKFIFFVKDRNEKKKNQNGKNKVNLFFNHYIIYSIIVISITKKDKGREVEKNRLIVCYIYKFYDFESTDFLSNSWSSLKK